MNDNDLTKVVYVKVTAEDIDSKSYTCNECAQPFGSEKSLKKHIAVVHHNISMNKERSARISYRFNCPIASCRRSLKMDKEYFTTRKHLHQHYYKVHKGKNFACPNKYCDKKFSTEVLKKLHLKDCGKIFTCHCNCCFNSKEALLTHQRRKHPTGVSAPNEKKAKELINNNSITKRSEIPAATRTVSTTTSGLGLWNSTENLMFPSHMTSVFTSTDRPIAIAFETKSTLTDLSPSPSAPKLIKNSSTSTAEDFTKEENSNSLSSSSSQNKNKINWSGDFDDSIIFDSDVKMEFYSAETQTDFTENLFNNNYTQTTFTDLDFEKFDIQTQTNWDE